MKVTFLGTGTSQGVPVIGCECDVCTSTDARDKRLRTSIMLSKGGKNLVIDAGPDFRQQMLRAGIKRIEAVLITHQHNDHVMGLDDVRPFNFRYKMDMPIYATQMVQDDLKHRFAYAFSDTPYPGVPQFQLHTLHKDVPFEVAGFSINPIELMHGNLPVMGFRFDDFTYLTDVNRIENNEFKKIIGTKTLVIDALHHRKHYSHFNLEQALEHIKLINPERAYLIHISHLMGKTEEINAMLPQNVQLAYDGLVISIA